jgi:hypothetical protein
LAAFVLLKDAAPAAYLPPKSSPRGPSRRASATQRNPESSHGDATFPIRTAQDSSWISSNLGRPLVEFSHFELNKTTLETLFL